MSRGPDTTTLGRGFIVGRRLRCDAVPPRGQARTEGKCEHLGKGNGHELEARARPLTPTSKRSPEAISWVQTPDSSPWPRIQRAWKAEPHAPLLPCSPCFGPRAFSYLPGPGGLSSSPASSSLPAPSSLRVPFRGRGHVRCWQL